MKMVHIPEHTWPYFIIHSTIAATNVLITIETLDGNGVYIPGHVWPYLAICGAITTTNMLVTIETLWTRYE